MGLVFRWPGRNRSQLWTQAESRVSDLINKICCCTSIRVLKIKMLITRYFKEFGNSQLVICIKNWSCISQGVVSNNTFRRVDSINYENVNYDDIFKRDRGRGGWKLIYVFSFFIKGYILYVVMLMISYSARRVVNCKCSTFRVVTLQVCQLLTLLSC